MNFFVIRPSTDTRVIGNYPQVEEIIHNCHVWNEPRFIEHYQFEQVLGEEPITSNARLYDSSKLTDLISVSGIGFTKRLLISDKLKNLLETHRSHGVQYFPSDVIQNGQRHTDYWVINFFESDEEHVDFMESQVVVRVHNQDGGTSKEKREIDSLGAFRKYKPNKDRKEKLFIEGVCLKKETPFDFICLPYVEGGIKYVVSETLKQKILANSCTGVEFMPLHLSLAEWQLSQTS